MNSHSRIFFIYLAYGVFFILGLGSNHAHATEIAYPSKTIRIIVGFAAGGPNDRVAREVAAKLQEAWAVPVIVENRPGVGGRIAFETVAKAPPDGYTLVVSGAQASTMMAVHRKWSINMLRDFEPVTQLSSSLLVLAVNPATGVDSLTSLVEFARKKNAPLTYSTAGVASAQHFAGELFGDALQIPLTHVPFSGAAPAQMALAGGQVDFSFVAPMSATPLFRDGRLRALAVTSATRARTLSTVPTLAELGLSGFVVNSWQAMLAPAGTPQAIVDKLHRTIAAAFSQEEMRARLRAIDAEPLATSPAEFRVFLRQEIERWSNVAEKSKIAID